MQTSTTNSFARVLVNLSLQKAQVISPPWSSQDGSPAPQALSQQQPPAFPSCPRLPRTSPSPLHNWEGKENGHDGGVVDGDSDEIEMHVGTHSVNASFSKPLRFICLQRTNNFSLNNEQFWAIFMTPADIP